MIFHDFELLGAAVPPRTIVMLLPAVALRVRAPVTFRTSQSVPAVEPLAFPRSHE